MMDLSSATHEHFESSLNQAFSVIFDNAIKLELELIEVKPLGKGDPNADARQPFSLLFRGPLEPMLPQQLHRLENPGIGEMSLFLVPIGPDRVGMLYDATFN